VPSGDGLSFLQKQEMVPGIHKVVGKKTHPCKKMAKIVEITVLKFYILIRTEKGKLIER
jgi:hypothetical protein